MRLNIGCGPSPTPGWVNFDNSPSVFLSRMPKSFIRLLGGVQLLSPEQLRVIEAARTFGIRRGSATHLRLEAATVDAVYSSHMLEHLDRAEARRFLLEAHRVLHLGGWLRVVVPDLESCVRDYLSGGDADAFVERLRLAMPAPRGRQAFVQRLVGFRGHRWMYDSRSLAGLIESCGFSNVQVVGAGQTNIPDVGQLDLREREGESIYVEAQKVLQ